MLCSSESGQSTVEAAVLLPIFFVVLGMLVQPSILLYNRCIMNAAAAEGCRLVATSTGDDASVRAYLERRLASIPKIDVFHEGDLWEIGWSKNASQATVTISNHAKPLPLFGIIAAFANVRAEDNCIEQRIEVSSVSLPAWAGALESGPSGWIGAWK